MMEVADFVVVGAGSAGCVVAARLSETGARVVLLEAGPRDGQWLVRVPAGALKLRGHPVLDWNFVTDPVVNAGGRPFQWPRGRVLGGSSSINGMNFVRGLPSDFDYWAQAGCRGWSFDEVLPYFRKMERYDGGLDEDRGRDGPLRVEDYNTILPITHKFVRAADQAGFAVFPDLNGRVNEGVGYSQMSRDGRFRASSTRFLARRPNLCIETDAVASNLQFEGTRCVGVAYSQRGQPRTVRANREVVVAAGAIGSPHLLQISGVGPAEHLRSIGVEVVHDSPGVGENLSDHYAATVSHRTHGVLTLNQIAHGPRLLWSVAQWLAFGTGPLTFGATTASVFCRSRPGLEHPDIQVLFVPGSFHARTGGDKRKQLGQLEAQPGVRVSVSCAHPESRGTVMARSADPRERPAIAPGYLGSRRDVEVLISGIRIARRIFAQAAISPHIVSELMPGKSLVSDEELETYIRQTGHTAFHPAGTCKMGEDPMAVVDPRLRVRGIGGLRVIDASVMPAVTTGNINAPTLMIGEKGAAMLIEDRT